MSSLTQTDPPSIAASDLDLLRRFEPVVRYTTGEQFFPTDVERYVQRCSLWEHYPDGSEQQIVPEGELSLERLVEPHPAEFGTVQFLRFVAPLSLTESAQAISERLQLERRIDNVFHAGQGRLARGGLLPRLADALFAATLLLRGRVPGATAAMAELDYYKMQQAEEKYVYHGRVARQGGWTILQYWFFYCYNSWRSGFRGVNDHESDWEMVVVYLYEEDGLLTPEWAAYASHDFHGDDLRRRWDDRQELELSDGHPVVYAGAGSHASYFRLGEYQAEASLPLPSWASKGLQAWSRFWTQTLGQRSRGGNPLRIPFVDYARGDGLSVGPGQPKQWTPVLIDETTPWVSQYRGLWGFFARDPISGENAPAGPMYNRDGSPRGSWYDPLGFAGLDRVPPPPEELHLLELRHIELDQRQEELARTVPQKAAELQVLGIELKSMERNPHLAKQHQALARKVDEVAVQVRDVRREQSQNATLLDSVSQRLSRLQAGEKDPPRAHIRRLATPVPVATMRFNRFVEGWAAVSMSMLLLGIAALYFLYPQFLWLGIVILVIAFIVIESILRGTFVSTATNITVLLAVLSSLVLFAHFWSQILILGLVAIAVFLLLQKVRELRS